MTVDIDLPVGSETLVGVDPQESGQVYPELGIQDPGLVILEDTPAQQPGQTILEDTPAQQPGQTILEDTPAQQPGQARAVGIPLVVFVEGGINVPPASAYPQGISPSIEVGPVYVEVTPACASPSAKQPEIHVGPVYLDVSPAYGHPTAVDPSVVGGEIDVDVAPSHAHPAAVDPQIEVGPVYVDVAYAAAHPTAVDPQCITIEIVSVDPAHAQPQALTPAISLGVYVPLAAAHARAKTPKVRVKPSLPRKLRVGALSPQAMEIEVRACSVLPDLSNITTAEIQVYRPDKSLSSWDAVISSRTATKLTLLHLFRAGDLDLPGNYEVKAVLTTNHGITVRTEPARQHVDPPWEI